MDQIEQQEAFASDLQAMCERYSQEFELTYPSVIGVLEIQKVMIQSALVDEIHGGSDYE